MSGEGFRGGIERFARGLTRPSSDGRPDAGAGLLRVTQELALPGAARRDGRPTVQVAAGSAIGRLRINQDRVSVSASCLVLCDGVGASPSGHVAAAVACAAAAARAETDLYRGIVDPLAAVAAADAAVRATQELIGDTTATSTVTVVILHESAHGPTASVGWLGDSPAWLLHQGLFFRLTIPHHKAQQMAEDGLIDYAEVDRHQAARSLTAAAGMHASAPAAARSVVLGLGDRLIVASDGLGQVLDDQTIGATVDAATTADAAVANLLDAAVSRNPDDNVTVAVARVGRADGGSLTRDSGVLAPGRVAGGVVQLRVSATGLQEEPPPRPAQLAAAPTLQGGSHRD